MWNNVDFVPSQARYPRPLKVERDHFDPGRGPRVLEDASRVRLAVAPGGSSQWLVFSAATDQQPWHRLQFGLPVRKGAHVDVLLPRVSTERSVFDSELALGYEGALAETRRFWHRTTACDTRVAVPEAEIDDCIRQSIRFSGLLAEKNPATGKYCKVNGSWTYADLWATPGAMDLVMLLDTLGYHRTVGRYLNIFLDEQGTVKPPGPAYELHRGYLSTPARYKSIDWLSDNGAVLYTLAMHGLLTGDREFIAWSTDAIIRSCEWIAESRRKENHGGYEGVLPPAVATDNQPVIQGVWSIGYVFHSWQLGDRARFLEGMYSLFAGAMSRQTRISCETRGGITGNVFASSLAIYLTRPASPGLAPYPAGSGFEAGEAQWQSSVVGRSQGGCAGSKVLAARPSWTRTSTPIRWSIPLPTAPRCCSTGVTWVAACPFIPAMCTAAKAWPSPPRMVIAERHRASSRGRTRRARTCCGNPRTAAVPTKTNGTISSMRSVTTGPTMRSSGARRLAW